MRSKLILFSLIYLFAVILVIADKVEAQRVEAQRTEAPEYGIRLKSRRFTPPEEIMGAIQSYIQPSPHERVHVLMQFYDIPDVDQRGILKGAGVKLLNYIPHKAWFVSVPRGITQAHLINANVRWIGPILPEDRIFPPILNRGVGSWAINEDGSVNLEVSIFKDVSLVEARNLMVGMGAVIKEESTVSNRLTVTISPDRLMDIANEDIVRWIIEERPPKIPLNDGSRANVGADVVQASPYELGGLDVDVGIWDAGDVDSTHDDFGIRVTIVDGAGVHDHATHVAGTMGGDGTLSEPEGGTAYQWKGMAPEMDIISYYWDNNLTDHEGAIATYGIELSQNSWGYQVTNPDLYGYYGYDAPEYDDIVTGLYGKEISVVFAAGNDRDDVAYDYDTIGPPSTAKNIICVGAINSDDDSMTYFSGWGPMNDGRIKPDVVAPGDEVGGDGGIKSTVPPDTYDVYIGTSMSAPCVSGCASLIIEDYRMLYSGVDPLPSTVKALLMHEGKDLGNTGPDYSYGFGDIQIQDSIDKLRTKSLVEDEVGHAGTDTYTLYVPDGTTEVKITLVWDDEPATEGADPALVNDLDLIVKDPDNIRYYPWTLDPANPSNPAVQTQEDHTNNVEQVLVDGSIVIGSWTIEVYGYNVATVDPQKYSLIFTPNYGANVIGKIYKDSGYSKETKFFDRTDPVYIEGYVVSEGSPLTGASVTADLKLMSDGSTVTTITLADVGGGYYRNSWDSTGGTPDVYLVDINVADPPLNTKGYFHLYPQSGVSAYRLDYDEDGNDDYVLENKHLISVFDGKTDTDKSLLYLYQKDTALAYNFAGILDTDSIGRGEITTSNMKGIKFSSFSLVSGENLASSTFGVITDLTKDLFSDGFESGDFITGGWSLDSPPPDIGTEDVYEGIYSAGKKVYSGYADNYHRMWRTVDTTGHTNITFSYARAVEDAGAGTVTFTAEYSPDAGATWVEVETVTDTDDVFTYVSWPLPADAENNPNLVIRFGGIFGGTTSAGANDWWVDDVKVTSSQVESKIETQFNIAIQMKTEDVDYLVYKLSGFDEFIDDINNIFSPISGSLGLSVEDDRYHIGDGRDYPVNYLTPGSWTDFNSSLTDQQKYVAIYDDSTANDPVYDNVISWVYFPNAATVSFQDVGCWYETGKEALRIRYDTTLATTTNQAEYILAFTQGNYSAIDQWMSTIAGGAFPDPNFMTSPSVLSVSVNPNTWPIDGVSEGSITQSTELDDITVTNDSAVTETFTLNITLNGSSWLPGMTAGDETYVMWGLFCGADDAPTSDLFQDDDIILAGSPTTATESFFGDPSLSDNGVSVEAGTSVDLWFQFQAPTSTSYGGEEQLITVTVGAQEP